MNACTCRSLMAAASSLRSSCSAMNSRIVCSIKKRGSLDRKSTRLNSSHRTISYAVFCLKKNAVARLRVRGQPDGVAHAVRGPGAADAVAPLALDAARHVYVDHSPDALPGLPLEHPGVEC